MCRLALLLQVKGDTAEAAATYLRMLQMSLDGFGPEESSENLRSLNRLLNSQSDIAAAEAIYRKILKASDIAFGPEDSITLRCLNNLAILLSSTGRPSEAVDIFRSYTVKSNAAARAVKYDLACYECLAGNVADAKRLILECLGHDPDLKFQLRNDPDFLQIREFIQTL
jgi:tetratricopeptide (TPR) repeat protein